MKESKHEVTHKISAFYNPKTAEVFLTFAHLESNDYIELAVKVTPEQGAWFAKRVPAFVHHEAVIDETKACPCWQKVDLDDPDKDSTFYCGYHLERFNTIEEWENHLIERSQERYDEEEKN